jgi:tripartite-type tricarboxylate transporter receptor subunit TctC
MITRRQLIALSTAMAFTPGFVGRSARAQAWPSRFVRIIVPFVAGGGTDFTARILAGRLSEVWGQQVVVENRGGAGGTIGAVAAAQAEPDGHTMFLGSIAQAIGPYIYPTLGYDPVADFAPVTLICHFPNVMAVPNSSPAKTVAEFIAHAKANRGKISYASSGSGTSLHLSGELFKRLADIEMTHLPYRGAGAAMSDLIAGRVDVMFGNSTSMLPLVRQNSLRGLAVTSAKRLPVAAELPPIADDLPGFDLSSWYSFFVPAKTPPEIVRRMHQDTIAALVQPPIKQRFEEVGAVVIGSTPAELAAHLRAEMEKWGRIVRDVGIRVE